VQTLRFGLLFLVLAWLSLSAVAQVPGGINYQAVARQTGGGVLANQPIDVRMGILQGNPSGSIAWEEIHSVTTNSYGLFTLVIGQGQNTGGGSAASLAAVNWGSDSFFLKVEIDPGDGIWEWMGTVGFQAVPYAFHAKTADNADDADADPTNELIDSVTLDNSNHLTISEAGQTFTVDLSGLVNDSDADPANELLDTVFLDNSHILHIIEAGIMHSIDLSELVNDADFIVGNESLTLLQLVGTTLNLIESGQVFNLDLSPLQEDLHWSGDAEAIYNESNKVGIGTTDPQSTLDVNGSLSLNFRHISGGGIQTVENNDHTLFCNVSDAPLNLILPDAAGCAGRVYVFRKYSNNPPPITHALSLSSPMGQLVDAASSIVLNNFFPEILTLMSDGSKWWIMSKTTLN
jgi:hypothetical protein